MSPAASGKGHPESEGDRGGGIEKPCKRGRRRAMRLHASSTRALPLCVGETASIGGCSFVDTTVFRLEVFIQTMVPASDLVGLKRQRCVLKSPAFSCDAGPTPERAVSPAPARQLVTLLSSRPLTLSNVALQDPAVLAFVGAEASPLTDV
eukprot:1249954-Pleurochrysis_carterae.AAC.1